MPNPSRPAKIFHIALAAGAFHLSASCATVTDPVIAPAGFDQIRAFISDEIASGDVPNAVALVAQDNQILFDESFGELSPGRKAGPDMIVRLDSLTKPLTAAAIMILADEERIALDDPVEKYLPAFAAAKVERTDPATGEKILTKPARPITIHDLLTHTAGLAGYSAEVDALWNARTNAEFANGVAALPLRHDPGDGFQYGNAYEVLPAIVAAASGVTFDVFLQERLFGPLGMIDTHFVVPQEKLGRYSALYTKDENGKLIVMSRPDDPPSEAFPSGGGGLKSTAHDYYLFARMLLDKGTADGARILSEQAVAMMTRPQVARSTPGSWRNERAWGYGLAVKDKPSPDGGGVGTFGWNGGMGTLFFVDPGTRLIGVIFTQIHWSNDHDLREGFQERAFAATRG